MNFMQEKHSRLNLKGVLYGILAAICYGTNPLGALHLYAEGFSPDSVLFYRFVFGCLFLGLTILFTGKKFRVSFKELKVLFCLGVLFALTALTNYGSFCFMDAGLASTLLFLYPLEVALIMGIFFKEKLNKVTAFSIGLSLVGIACLYRGGNDGMPLNSTGLLLVLISSLSYAVYIVVVSKAKLLMGSVKLSFWAMFFCLWMVLFYGICFGSGVPKIPSTFSSLGWCVMLGLVPTFLSLVFMAKAVKLVGSTPTAVMGALEALTAVFIGTVVFHEVLTPRLILGIGLILFAVTFMAAKKVSTNEKAVK
jgi:drug/metabolite transporter (DMT)-like permease